MLAVQQKSGDCDAAREGAFSTVQLLNCTRLRASSIMGVVSGGALGIPARQLLRAEHVVEEGGIVLAGIKECYGIGAIVVTRQPLVIN